MELEKTTGSANQPSKMGFASLQRLFVSDRDFMLFLIVGIFSGIANGINSTVFNNFLSDVYKLSAEARGAVEFPRELPGVFIMVVLGLFSFLGDIRMAAVGMLLSALGMVGLGLFSPTYASMMVWMMMLSLGTHIFFPLSPGIGMSLSKKENYGMRLGQISAYTLSATIIGYAIVWLGFKYFSFTYHAAFITAAVFFVFSAFFLGLMNPRKPEEKKAKFIFRKKYMLYYGLSVVNGARKQVFMTFAPWVLIQVYHLDPPVFAVLGVVISLAGILSRTIVGKAIDIKGEKFILTVEAAILIVICLGYAFAADIFPPAIAVVLISGCYIIDNALTAVGMARSTYVKKIAVHPDDVTPTLSAGTSYDHVIAMSIPFFGGLLWASMGYKYVFLAAAAIAAINLFMARKIRID